MELEEAARQSGVIPADRIAALISCLKKTPDYSWLLTAPHQSITRLQGDLLRDFPVAIVDRDGNPLCRRLTVLVLNNTCDLQPQRSEFVIVAPVMDFGDFSESVIHKRGEVSSRNYLKDVMANNVFEILWLPSFGSFRHGAVVFLDKVCATASVHLESALQNHGRVASFSQSGFYFLLLKITKHIARPESEEVIRNAM